MSVFMKPSSRRKFKAFYCTLGNALKLRSFLQVAKLIPRSLRIRHQEPPRRERNQQLRHALERQQPISSRSAAATSAPAAADPAPTAAAPAPAAQQPWRELLCLQDEAERKEQSSIKRSASF
jgi:hypothetical protein